MRCFQKVEKLIFDELAIKVLGEDSDVANVRHQYFDHRTLSWFHATTRVPGESNTSSLQSAPLEFQTKMVILFLSANPSGTDPINVDEELRNLEKELQAVKFRNNIRLVPRHAIRIDDLIRHVTHENPDVIHFSGHGTEAGITLCGDEGRTTVVSGQSLRQFLSGRGVKLVVLNACLTKKQAQEINGVVPAVVGTTMDIRTAAARQFTVAFYRGLGNGHSIEKAFIDGRDAVGLGSGDYELYWSDGNLKLKLVDGN